MNDAPPPVAQKKSIPSLSFKHLFNHFFLLHDFFHRLTKSKSHNPAFFDLQIQIYTGMTNSVKTGSKTAQFVTITSLVTYFLKGNSIRLRFLYGFLFMYWYNHVMTLGSYAGVLCRMPGLYKRTVQYYESHSEQKNLVQNLNIFLEQQGMYQDTQPILQKLFEAEAEQKSYVANDFFVKNKQKYMPKEVLQWSSYNSKKLVYFDSFLTRYIYYSFARWYTRMKNFLSVKVNQ